MFLKCLLFNETTYFIALVSFIVIVDSLKRYWCICVFHLPKIDMAYVLTKLFTCARKQFKCSCVHPFSKCWSISMEIFNHSCSTANSYYINKLRCGYYLCACEFSNYQKIQFRIHLPTGIDISAFSVSVAATILKRNICSVHPSHKIIRYMSCIDMWFDTCWGALYMNNFPMSV